VALWAKALGLDAHILRWRGAKPAGDIEAAAREARYRLMGEWLMARGVRALCVGHTREDQAETFLLRLGRGSGLDGLAAMRPLAGFPLVEFRELAILRPLLSLERRPAREHLSALGQAWFEDPMNEDLRFGRARLRANWDALEGLGLSARRIADAALHLSRARDALDEVTVSVLARSCRLEGKLALIDREALVAAPRELALRALARLLMAVSGHTYRPRFEALERVFDWLAEGDIARGCTLHGCHIGRAPKAKAIFGPDSVQVSPEPPRRTRKGRKLQRSRNRHSAALS
jgi:tRNA(Ile)-lysidine synthase